MVSFLNDLRQNIGANCLVQNCQTYENNISEIKRRVSYVLKPKTQDEVIAIVRLANKHKISLYPISTGKNWGLGSKLPTNQNSVVVDLSLLKNVVAYSAEYGYAIVEPGVTQQDLSTFLETHASPYHLDVTGSSADTSIIGNALERGVAYNTHRSEITHSFKVVTGSGEVVTTGQNSSLRHIYKNATGPSITELFFQSNLGIVLEATVQLMAKPEASLAYNIAIQDEKDLPEVINTARKLIAQQTLTGIPHIFDIERFHSALLPLLERETQRRHLQIDLKKLMRKHFSGAWWMVGSLQGSKDVVNARAKIIKANFKRKAKVQILNPRTVPTLTKITRLLGLTEFNIILSATEMLRDLPTGKPSNESLLSILHPFSQRLDYCNLPDLEESPTGCLFVCPGIPLDRTSITQFLATFNRYRHNHLVVISASINPITANFGEGVISFTFPRYNHCQT